MSIFIISLYCWVYNTLQPTELLAIRTKKLRYSESIEFVFAFMSAHRLETSSDRYVNTYPFHVFFSSHSEEEHLSVYQLDVMRSFLLLNLQSVSNKTNDVPWPPHLSICKTFNPPAAVLDLYNKC